MPNIKTEELYCKEERTNPNICTLELYRKKKSTLDQRREKNASTLPNLHLLVIRELQMLIKKKIEGCLVGSYKMYGLPRQVQTVPPKHNLHAQLKQQ
jgi:hypothetical protein